MNELPFISTSEKLVSYLNELKAFRVSKRKNQRENILCQTTTRRQFLKKQITNVTFVEARLL